jgi:Na+-driven multidrug efflux pump
MAIGAAPSLVNMATSAVNAIINTSLMAYGDNAVAAAGIFTTYASLLGMVMLGMCQGMQPIVGYSYGAGHPRRAISTFWLTVRCASVVAIIGCAVGLSFPRAIASVFTVDTGLIDVTANALSIALIMYWIVGFQMVTTNFFMSIGKAGRSIFLSLTRQVLFLIPMLLILPRHFGLSGIWASFPAADVISTLLSAAMIAWELRRLRLTHPTGA